MKYELGLSSEEIFNLCKYLDVYSQKLERARNKLLNRLADEALNVIKQNCPSKETHPDNTGDLINSIQKSEIFEQTIHVFTDNYYAQFVEFGTGVVGLNNPHPDAGNEGWQYNSSGKGEQGWHYIDKRTGKSSFTHGQTGKQFMYKAYQYLEQNYMRIGEEVFKEEGLI